MDVPAPFAGVVRSSRSRRRQGLRGHAAAARSSRRGGDGAGRGRSPTDAKEPGEPAPRGDRGRGRQARDRDARPRRAAAAAPDGTAEADGGGRRTPARPCAGSRASSGDRPRDGRRAPAARAGITKEDARAARPRAGRGAAAAGGRRPRPASGPSASPLSRIKQISGPNLAAQLADDPARHPARRGRHHRPRGVPQAASTPSRGRQGDDGRAADEGVVGVAEGVPGRSTPRSTATTLILKRYYHIGFAADTPQGLVVPVIRDVDRKGLLEIAGELTRAVRQGARGQARAGRDAAARRSRSRRSAASAARLHADRQPAAGRDPRRRRARR